MRRRYTPSYNCDLKPLPEDEAFIQAVIEIQGQHEARHAYKGASAADVAHWLRVQPARRAGNGAVKGSWSGNMSPAMRVVSRLSSLVKQGKLTRMWDGDYHRWAYYIPDWYSRWKA